MFTVTFFNLPGRQKNSRWLTENADLYATFEKAIESPRFAVWRFPGHEPFSLLAIQFPDIPTTREMSRLLLVRANYRIGKGDIDGAIADQRLIFRLCRHLLDNPNACIIEHLMGLANYSIGYSICINGNPDFPITKEQIAQMEKNWQETFGQFDFDQQYTHMINGERFLFFTPTAYDFVTVNSSRRIAFMRDLLNDSPLQVTSRAAFLYRVVSVIAFSALDGDVFLRRVNFVWDKSTELAKLNESKYNDFVYNEVKNLSNRKSLRLLSPNLRVRSEAVADLFLATLLSASHAANEAIHRSNCCANLLELQQAMFRFQAEVGTLPPAFTVDKNGKPLHSWRVLLPYLGSKEKELYAKIRLNEPWNSEYNRQFHLQSPAIYQCPSHPTGKGTISRKTQFIKFQYKIPYLQPGDTSYAVIVGPNSLFDKSGNGRNLKELTKQPAKKALGQFMIVERTTPVCWMKPDTEITEEVAFQNGINGSILQLENSTTSEKYAEGLGSFHSGGINVAIANGSLRFLSETIPQNINRNPDGKNDEKSPYALEEDSLGKLIFGKP